eukprot:COSAG01_NODE_18279_length_1087_cov_1.103239_3_plen_86_part_01
MSVALPLSSNFFWMHLTKCHSPAAPKASLALERYKHSRVLSVVRELTNRVFPWENLRVTYHPTGHSFEHRVLVAHQVVRLKHYQQI